MKHPEPVTTLVLCTGIVATLLLSCRKTEDQPQKPGGTDTTGTLALFEQLRFFEAEKISGAVPQNAVKTSLRKSFADTLVLFEDLQTPFKFLHQDAGLKVAGLFVSFEGSPYYYDVPELQKAKTNDTVSVFTMGFAKMGEEATETFELLITPYNASRQPVTQFKTKVTVKKAGAIDVDGFCGLMQEIDEYWDWELSYIPAATNGGTLSFINYPLKVWDPQGQIIKGSCCGRSTSIYGLCPGADSANRSLHFSTFFAYPLEQFVFKRDRTFTRRTAQIYGKPDLDKSNWCTNFAKTDTSVQLVSYTGNWSIAVRSVPAELHVDYSSREYLALQTTESTGGLGWGNPGGFIHILECGGYLWLIQPDLERSDRNLFKFYTRKKENEEYWHIINVQ